jgi:hypothetical protein
VPPVAVLVEGCRAVLGAFGDDIGRAPGLVELVEILHDGVRTLPDEILVDAHPDEIVGFIERPRVQSSDTEALGDLNDAAYVAASAAFNAWWQAGPGQPITVADLAAVVLEAVRQVGPDLLDAAEVARLTAIAPKLRHAKARARIGDIIAVPTGDHAYHLVVLVCRNSFGTAFGLFRGRHPLRIPPANLAAAATGVAIYSAEDAIKTGRWRIAGHNEQVLGCFPAEPEIYHRPQPPIPGIPAIGEFGAAETAAGRLRDLTPAEAREIDLAGSYRQTYLPKSFEQALAGLIARHSG